MLASHQASRGQSETSPALRNCTWFPLVLGALTSLLFPGSDAFKGLLSSPTSVPIQPRPEPAVMSHTALLLLSWGDPDCPGHFDLVKQDTACRAV